MRLCICGEIQQVKDIFGRKRVKERKIKKNVSYFQIAGFTKKKFVCPNEYNCETLSKRTLF